MPFIYRTTWLICRVAFRIYFRWRVFDEERVPPTGPVILAANHTSFLDPPMVGTAVTRTINYLARESLFRFPLFGAYLRALNTVPVDRDGQGAKGLKMILDRLFKGGGIILFPEGTRSIDGRLQKARSGIGLTVIKSDAPVVPVRVFGSYEAWNRRQLFPRPRRVVVCFGNPLDFTNLRAEAKNCSKARTKEIYQEVADEIMRHIADLKNPLQLQASGNSSDGPGPDSASAV